MSRRFFCIVLTVMLSFCSLPPVHLDALNAKGAQMPVPALSLLPESYVLTDWKGGGVSYIENGAPSLVDEDGTEALRYVPLDSQYTENDTGSFFRAQLDDKYFAGSEQLEAGDRIYISFMARAESLSGDVCRGQLYLSTVSSVTDSTLAKMSDTLKFEFTGEWVRYSGFLNVTRALADDEYLRFRMDIGYRGQTTYLTDFKIYKCFGTDDEVKSYAEKRSAQSMVKIKQLALSGAGSGSEVKGSLEIADVHEAAVSDDFIRTFKFTSTDYNNTANTSNSTYQYKARLHASCIDSAPVLPGDKLLLTFWAKGEYTGTEDGMTAYMIPELQASDGGSGGVFVGRLNPDGTLNKSRIGVPNEWKRYGCIFEVPESETYDMQINWYIGCVNQSITFAEPELYNLGAISVLEAWDYLGGTDAAFFYKTIPMEWESDTICSARAPIGVYGIDTTDIAIVTSNEFTSCKTDVAPHVGTEYGTVTITAPDGTQKVVSVRVYAYADYEEHRPEVGFDMNADGSTVFWASFEVRSNVTEPKAYTVAAAKYLGNQLTECGLETITADSAGAFTAEVGVNMSPGDDCYYKAFVFETNTARPVGRSCEYAYKPAKLIAEEAFSAELVHNEIENEIGIPSLIDPSGNIPKFSYLSGSDSKLDFWVEHEGRQLGKIKAMHINANTPTLIDISDFTATLSDGEYKIQLEAEIDGTVRRDALYFFVKDWSKQKPDDSKLVYMGDDGKLVYIPDYKGNKIMDYSSAGYKNGKEAIPGVEAAITVSPSGGDDTDAIQAAIDYVSSLPLSADGIRGAVQLSKGVFKVGGMLSITADGVVLKGSGNDNPNIADAVPTGDADAWAEAHSDTDGTIILLTTKEVETRMMDIMGTGGAVKVSGTEQALTDEYIPTGAKSITVADASGYSVGDEIIIEQYGSLAWVHEIGMDAIPPRETVDANVKNNNTSGVNQWTAQTWQFEREITGIAGNKIFLDIPIAAAIDKKWGGAVIYKYTDTGRISNIGIEDMRVVAAWTPNENNVDDTRHAGELVTIRNAKDVWISNITTEHLFLYNINIHKSAKRITVQDFYDLIAPKSYYNGVGYESSGRTFLETKVYVGRYGIYIGGQQVLMQRVYGRNLRHLIEYQSRAAGPNVAKDCVSQKSLTQMGPHSGWSVGGLYDSVDGPVHIQNRLNMGSGHGWAGAWYTAWNCTGRLAVQKPPTAQNYSVGHTGTVHLGDYPEFEQGYRDLQGTHSNILSLYEAQVDERVSVS